MRIPFFSKSNAVPKMEKKSNGMPAHVSYLFDLYGDSILSTHISPLLSYDFYHKISPLQGTINKITTAIAELPLVMRSDEDPDEITKEADILTLLNKPSPNRTKKQFLTDITTCMMLTREMWIVAKGPINRPPLELVAIKPYEVQIVQEANREWPSSIEVNKPGERIVYKREIIQGRYRYIDRIRMNEIFPYVSETENTVGSFRGVSKLTSLKDELLSYSASITGNTASMKNAGRPSGVIAPEDDSLDEEQMEDLEKSIKSMEGVYNKDKLVIIPAKVKAVFQKWAPKDMDYEVLQKNIKGNIWRLYSMPLPIVNDASQKFSNFSEGQTAFYDEAVNQAWTSVSDGLEYALSTRYDIAGQTISYNPFEVPALKRRAIEQTEKMAKGMAFKTNEIRKSVGHVDVPEGDDIMVSAKSAPLSSVVEGASLEM